MLLNTALPSGRLIRIGAVAFAFLLLAFLSQHLFFKSSYVQGLYTASDNLNIAVFATSGNYHLCQLHMSAALMGYPAHTLINWDDPEDKDPMKQHLAKIEGALRFLEEIPAARQDDLVFMVDGYDLWFQLPHSYIVKRYRDVVKKSHERHVAEFGEALVAKHKIRNTVLFGPDKQCAPAGRDHASCWAVPESWMPPLSFGPDTAHGRDTHNRPRWLNSGTIMGPAKDMRAMFNATMSVLRRKFDEEYEFKTSDQFYFQEMWTEQEIRRLELKNGTLQAPMIKEDVKGIIPSVPEGIRTEFHVTIDYDSDAFQTSAYYTEYITWMSFNHSTKSVGQERGTLRRMDQIVLSDDVLRSRPPFAISKANKTVPTGKDWTDMMLGTNAITQKAFPLLHITNEKVQRVSWWPNMWFHPHTEALFEAAKDAAAKSNLDTKIVAEVRGTSYVGAKGLADNSSKGDVLGAWTDRRTFLPWDDVCSGHDKDLFV